MNSRLFRCLKVDLITTNVQQIRNGHYMRGKPPHLARTLKQRLEEMNYKDPELYFKVNIGFKQEKLTRRELTAGYMNHIQKIKSDPQYERKARNRELIIDIPEMKKDWWTTDASQQIKTIADHYGVYDHLFGDAYFYPIIPLDIQYDFGDDDKVAVVHRGNVLKPCEALKAPEVKYDANPDSLWTLLLTTPDGNLTSPQLEYCHWFIGNIPGSDLAKGDLLIDYLRPIPVQGIGYCRYIFVLYKQDKKIDFSEYKKPQPCLELVQRNWSTLEFYRKYQDIITPAGLAFYQADWDASVQDFFHKTLDTKSPRFEYDFPAPYIRPQVWFPKRQPFNLYLDKYRNPKDINVDYLMKKLKKTHPFDGPVKPLKYPNARPISRGTPTWLIHEIKKERRGWGRINEIE